MIDPGRVRAKIAMLQGYRARLARLAALPLESYLAEHDLEGRYAVQVAAQACLDLANHVIASEGWQPATDFRDSFTRERHPIGSPRHGPRGLPSATERGDGAAPRRVPAIGQRATGRVPGMTRSPAR